MLPQKAGMLRGKSFIPALWQQGWRRMEYSGETRYVVSRLPEQVLG